MNIHGLKGRGASTSQLVELALHRCKMMERLNLFTNRICSIDDRDAIPLSVSFRDVGRAADATELSASSSISVSSSSAAPFRLAGMPVSIKDNFCTREFPATCGSRMLSDFAPPYDATVVARLKGEGAVVIGKNNMDEFAMGSGTTDSCFGPSINPWSFRRELEDILRGEDDSRFERLVENAREGAGWHVCGGSSGGGAGAVAAGLVMAAIGSDTGGSTRVPASHCGVVGLKPTYGRISRHGLIPLVNSLDVPGILTRSVDDAALILNVLTGPDENFDSTSVLPENLEEVVLPTEPSVDGVTVGIPKEYFHPYLHPKVAEVWRQTADNLREAGARVVPVSLPHTRFSIVTYSVLCCCEVASNMARYDGLRFGHRDARMDSTEAMYARSRSFGFNDVVRGRILAGNYFLSRKNYHRYFVKALQVRRLITEELFTALRPGVVDVLLTPTTPAPAMTFKEYNSSSNRERTAEADVFTQAVNLAGLPAVSVPVALSEGDGGMPIGLQLIGQPFLEESILKVAKWIEKEIQFPHLPDLYFCR